jgi:hypothetical protein
MTNLARTDYELPQEITGLLARTRKILRQYLGRLLMLRLVVAALVAFLLAWGMDYFPVWFGGRELGVGWRMAYQATACCGLGVLVFRGARLLFWGFASDSQLALLIERQIPELNNGLFTLLSVADRGEPLTDNSALMLRETEARTLLAVKNFEPACLLEQCTPRFWQRAAVVAGIVVLGLGLMFPTSFQMAGRRLLALDSAKYPRQYIVSLVGVRLRHEALPESIPELSQAAKFGPDGELYLARGMSLTVLAQVSRSAVDLRDEEIPPNCELRYRSDSGLTGRVLMKRVGRFRDGLQMFELDSPPFDQLGHDLRFYLRSGDHSVGPFTIRTVDPPVVIATSLDCQFPDYMVDAESLRWTSRSIPWNTGTRLPVGTRIVIHGQATSGLSRVLCIQEASGMGETPLKPRSVLELPVVGREFRWPLECLTDHIRSRIYLIDQNGVVSREPFLLSIDALVDQPPRVRTRLEGVGLAITPQAQLPIRGTIDDDYGVAKAWVELNLPEQGPIILPLPVQPTGEVAGLVDLRALQNENRQLILEAGSDRTIGLTVKAEDDYDLSDAANQGAGEAIRLALVTPNELLRLLERRESSERRRLEQIYDELSRAREYLSLIANTASHRSSLGAEPGDESELGRIDRERINRETRAIYASRLRLQFDKSAGELNGAADSFADLRMQLINNRLNAREREVRLAEQVIKPLREIAENLRGGLRENSRELQDQFQGLLHRSTFSDWEREISITTKITAHELELTLRRLQEVIVMLVKFETQNELIDLVRGMLKTQTEIFEKTREQRKKEAFEGLID